MGPPFCLPLWGHPRVVSLAPSGQFTSRWLAVGESEEVFTSPAPFGGTLPKGEGFRPLQEDGMTIGTCIPLPPTL